MPIKENYREYTTYKSMINRCLNPNDPAYARYGGRGISICERWQRPHGFANFLKDMGPRPADMTLDRIDVNGDYCPENCRWATWKVQNRNRRNSTRITYMGKTQSLKDWSEELGIPYGTLNMRYSTYKLRGKELFQPNRKIMVKKNTGEYSKRTGVTYDKTRGQWATHIGFNGKNHSKRFKTEEEAIAWRRSMERKFFGYTLEDL